MIQNRNAVQAAHEAREAPFRCDHQRVGVAAMLNPAQAGVIWLGVDKVAGAQCPRYDQLSEFLVCAWLGIWQDWCMADMTDGERIAEERIAEAARTGQDWLDLACLGLAQIPNNLAKLIRLKRLSLGATVRVTAGPISNFVRGVIWMEWKDPSIWP